MWPNQIIKVALHNFSTYTPFSVNPLSHTLTFISNLQIPNQEATAVLPLHSPSSPPARLASILAPSVEFSHIHGELSLSNVISVNPRSGNREAAPPSSSLAAQRTDPPPPVSVLRCLLREAATTLTGDSRQLPPSSTGSSTRGTSVSLLLRTPLSLRPVPTLLHGVRTVAPFIAGSLSFKLSLISHFSLVISVKLLILAVAMF